jgi:acyl transferase domain-containing protein/NAD(P)H-dependent flavin oxidoreductase YrpB (nitropropane dioxygenase family)/NAD(P)-dependent dehydrogenase (short-subunit alcohol dehydrogenase family)
MSLTIPRVLALAPSGWFHPALVVAASRAGALGVLDVGLDFEPERIRAALREIARFGDRPFGLRIAAPALDHEFLQAVPESLRIAIVFGIEDEAMPEAIARIRASNRSALVEVPSRTAAEAAARAGAEGLVLAGHEAGGFGSEESSFVLLQGVLARATPPVWVRGGVGPSVASACVAGGAAGVVLDGALLLARESPLPEAIQERIARWDGGETVVLGRSTGQPLRVFAPPKSEAFRRLNAAEAEGGPAWEKTVRQWVGWRDDQAWPVGQDAAFASRLAQRFRTVGGIIQAVARAIADGPRIARATQPMAEGSPLARAHRTRFPIVQGPMTRVSDTVAFAKAVADGGALPFLALAMMRGAQVRALLAEASAQLGERSWGVGILGFVPPELRQEQVEAIRQARPPFALIAGGRPDQARQLQRDGVPTYLHVPSPALLRQYLKDGARRFVLEGRECGGHVGPRSSFVLWEQASAVVRDAVEEGLAADEIHLLFAGGIHDARSAAMVAALAAPLAERGVRIGVLIGTAYLFTSEAIATGAIVPGFQEAALRCERTILLETGPGHEVRVCPSPFAETFERERQRLRAEGRPADEARAALERLNAGRLRIASKGLERSDGAGSPLVKVDRDDQRRRGLYMVGQVAALRDRVTTIADLHREISTGATGWLDRSAVSETERACPELARPSDIAIIGMAALFPGASNLHTFWENTLRGFDAITEIPADRWDWRLYFDPDPKAPDKVTSKWGGFVPEVPFDPLHYGMPPASVPSIEPMQLLTLEVVREALDDAGYRDRPFPRARTAVVLGAGGGAAQLAMGYAFRSYLPLLDTVIPGGGRAALDRCRALLPEWTEDSFPGILLNVAAGRVANRFDLGGANYTVDAACGSSLAAAALAVRELETGAADLVILGGADTVQNPFTYLAFSKTHAFSARGRCRPFDAQADGIVISEGVAAVVLKRLADAERDGDRIYAVIKGIGASSDGRAKGLTAPRAEGQIAALRRAYQKAGVSPKSVGYVEAHGTGTAAGDLAEVFALTDVFTQDGAAPRACALGSVKSLIGHTKCAAGLAGLINATLALHHKVLPPTIGIETLNPKARLESSPFYVNTSARPWLNAGCETPRRAGVSAFGFGGTNFHAVLEAYDRDPMGEPAAPLRDWPAELLVWRAPDRPRLEAAIDRLQRALDQGARPALRDLAHALTAALGAGPEGSALAIVATSLEDLKAKLDQARRVVSSSSSLADPRGVYYAERPALLGTKVAFLFPGQGSQYPGMLAELAVAFPEVRRGFEAFDEALCAQGRPRIGPLVFPPPAFDDQERESQRTALMRSDVAQPAVGAACEGLLQLLGNLGLNADLLAGHSYGELVALRAAGSFSLAALATLSEARGRFLLEAAGSEPGGMAALACGPAQVPAILEGIESVAAVNWNGPSQTVISGPRAAVERAVERARGLGIRAQILPVACAYHSPIVAGAREPLTKLVASLAPQPPRRTVYSNVTATPYPADPATIAAQLGEHLASPVRFAEMIEAMYKDDASVFIEVGPGGIVAALTGSILAGQPHLALACDHPGRPGIPSFLHSLARLFIAGVAWRPDRLTAGRATGPRDLDRLLVRPDPPAPTTWFVNGARARPALGPEVRVFGQGPALPPPLPSSAPVLPSPNGVPAPSASAGSDRVLEAFQRTMQTFLEVQRTAMLGYLSSRAATPAPREPGQASAQQPSPPSSLSEPERGPGQTATPAPQARSGPESANPDNFKFEISNLEPGASTGPAPGTLDRETIASRLLQLVRERTGYPAEMLRLDLDLEADLGIDSIKRVEILGSLREALPALGLGSDSETMDQLARARTLAAMVARIVAAARAGSGPPRISTQEADRNGPAHSVLVPAAGPALARVRALEGRPPAVQRRVLEVANAPLSTERAGLRPGGVVLVTDDGRGIARAIAADLRAMGHSVVRVRHGVADRESEGTNLASPSAVAALVERVRSHGPISGLIHALPLRDLPAAGLDPEAWASRMGPEVRGLFLLARAAAEDLARAAAHGGAALIAATALGGTFASAGGAPLEFFPGHGGIAGLVKTLAREWPGVRVRVVDFDPAAEAEVIAAHLVQEALTDDERSEVGHRAGRRVALRAVEAALTSEGNGPSITLKPGEPVLVTGGARGITAAIAADLARRWRPTLLLVGTSPLPPDEEDPETVGLARPSDLKAALHRRLQREDGAVGPADIERAYQALRRQREIRANLRALRAQGATVEYAQVDIRDADALGRVLNGWERRYGAPVGVIHGAGVIQDKLLCDKTLESFDRVLGTKLDGALALTRWLRPEHLRFTVLFSSVAGRYGNQGQGDYAAANEVLNKLAVWLDRRWPGRVVAMIWGPWSGVGMVSDLEAHLGRRGLGMIPPEVGCSLLADELRFGRKGDAEVIWTGDLGALEEPLGPSVSNLESKQFQI